MEASLNKLAIQQLKSQSPASSEFWNQVLRDYLGYFIDSSKRLRHVDSGKFN
jgi:hypothetical protein